MKRLVLVIPFLSYLFLPDQAFAHAFGKPYVLPLPPWLYLYGGGATVIVSFLLAGYFTKEKNEGPVYQAQDISVSFLAKVLTNQYIITLLQILSVFIFVICLISGFIGEQVEPIGNLLIIVFWIYLLLGILYLAFFFGNFWQVINPLRIVSDIVTTFTKRKKLLSYPKQLAYFPAFVFFLTLVWFELINDEWSTIPHHLAWVLIGYTVLTIVGVYLFGKNLWFEKAAVFSVIFSLISKLSIWDKKGNKLYLRPPFVGALTEDVPHVSLLFLIIAMLATAAYDGFHTTALFATIDNFLQTSLSDFFYRLAEDATLICAIFLFIALYFLAIWLMKIIVTTTYSTNKLALFFGYTLLPIVFAYNVAHYYTFFIVQGQSLIQLLSDPFNQNFNIFGTRDYIINTAIVSPGFVWNSQVGIIVTGHIIAVYLAHKKSLMIYKKRKEAIISQIPMLCLMVMYTITGLWILSQPLAVGK